MEIETKLVTVDPMYVSYLIVLLVVWQHCSRT